MNSKALSAHIIQTSLVLWLLLIPVVAIASTLHGTNTVAIAVEDQTQSSQRAALQEAFEQVVLKMSGDRDKYNASMLRGYSANDYLKAYQFELNESQLEYVATFDKAKLQQLLRRLALPIWEARRPDTLLWLSVENKLDSTNTVLSENTASPLSVVKDLVARRRGLNIALPIMDIEDANAVSVYDVWGRFLNPIVNASQRYSIDHIVIARIRETPEYDADELEQRIEELQNTRLDAAISAGDFSPATNERLPRSQISLQYPNLNQQTSIATDNDALFTAVDDQDEIPDPLFSVEEFRKLLNALQPFQLDYTFFIAGVPESDTLAGETQEQLLAEVLQRYADRLGQRYAIQLDNTRAEQQVNILVNNIDSLAKYTNVMQFLNQLTLVESVMLIEQIGHVAQFQVSLLTSRDRLIDSLVLDGRLMPVVNEFGEIVDDTQFNWNQ